MESKKNSIYANTLLLFWFFLDMIGVYFPNSYLVTRAWREDGIFFLIFLVSFILYIYFEKVGKYILSVWLTMWLVAQFLSHEYYTIFGGGERKIKYFEGAIKLIESETIYIPDIYHIILHILLIVSLVSTVKYIVKSTSIRKVN